MKALVLERYNELVYKDVPDPVIGPTAVLVRVKACGICGSDVHGVDGSTGRRRPPLIMGHEAAGVIAAVGKEVAGWAEGERVTFDSTIYCGTCWFCRRGEINLCDHRRVLGVSCAEYKQDGAFAEFVAVPAHILYRLPEGLSFVHAAAVEPVSIALHAVERTPRSLNDTALVIGAGTIGLLVIQTLRAAGCGRIIAADIDANRSKMALAFGADETLRGDTVDIPAALRDCTNGRGADLAIEAVGLESTIRTAIDSLRKGGALTLIGNLASAVSIPLQVVITKELDLRGSCASCGEYPACLDLMARGAINVAPLISAVAPLAEGAQWFARLRAGESSLVKVVLEP